jgi:uncharacterized protein YjbJ (UPF0337 family)
VSSAKRRTSGFAERPGALGDSRRTAESQGCAPGLPPPAPGYLSLVRALPVPVAERSAGQGRHEKGDPIVGMDDKIRNKGEEYEGKIKKNLGDATDDRSMEAEGRKDETAGKVKQVGEKVKDVFKG